MTDAPAGPSGPRSAPGSSRALAPRGEPRRMAHGTAHFGAPHLRADRRITLRPSTPAIGRTPRRIIPDRTDPSKHVAAPQERQAAPHCQWATDSRPHRRRSQRPRSGQPTGAANGAPHGVEGRPNAARRSPPGVVASGAPPSVDLCPDGHVDTVSTPRTDASAQAASILAAGVRRRPADARGRIVTLASGPRTCQRDSAPLCRASPASYTGDARPHPRGLVHLARPRARTACMAIP